VAKQAIEGAQTDVQLIGPLLRRLMGVRPLQSSDTTRAGVRQSAAEYAGQGRTARQFMQQQSISAIATFSS
jgi:hypothetical protein